MADRAQIQDAVNAGGGLLRLEPSWVPRSFMIPGRRLRLHPDDYYACGGDRGGINERWFSSTTNADNGPGTPPDEGLSYVRVAGALSVTLGLFALMVARRDDAWWWAWAFAIATGLCGTIATLHAAFGLPEGAGSFLWLLFAVVSWILTAGLVVGITRASQEHPIS